MVKEIILASKSGVRKKILEENNIQCKIEPSKVDEDSVKESLLKEKATPTIISKNLAERAKHPHQFILPIEVIKP